MYQNVRTINRLKNPMLLIVLLLLGSNPRFMVINAIMFHNSNNDNDSSNNNNHGENPMANSPESDGAMSFLINDLYPNSDEIIDDFKQNNFLKMIETPSSSSSKSPSPSSTAELIPAIVDPPPLTHVVHTRGSNKQHLCGDFLVKALALSCNGRYNKRNSMMAFGNKIPNENENDYKYKNEDTVHKNDILFRNVDHQEYESFYPSKTYDQAETNHYSSANNQVDAKELNWLILLNSLKNIPSTSSSFASTLPPAPSSFSSSLLSSSPSSPNSVPNGFSPSQTQSQLSSSSSAAAALKNHRRIRKRGVVEECCKHPCGLSTLRQYCATPPKSAEKD